MIAKLNPTKLIKIAITRAYKLRNLLVLFLAIGLIGYAGFLVSRLVDLRPDQAYIEEQRATLDQGKISFDKKTIQTINDLQQINPQVDLSNVGKPDPFSP